MISSKLLWTFCLALCFCVLNVFGELDDDKNSEKPTPGKLRDSDINSDEIQQAVTFALDELSKQESVNSKLVALEIVEAKQHVVAGTSYHLTLKVSESNCSKGDASVDCEALPDGKRALCTLKVWSQPWRNELKLQDVPDCKAL